MRYSQLFGKTTKTPEKDMTSTSHKLLYRGGFIRQISAGRYAFTPLGYRVWKKIYAIIQKEMDDMGVSQMVTPTLHPLDFWQKTNRDKAFGEEMMIVDDHHGAQFALGGTAEGMMVELVKKFNPTYKDLPILIYQFSSKFRDEKRPRGGLLRLREFMMKDAYSFTATENESLEIYHKFYDAYGRIAKTFDLDATPCISVSGAIGGDYNHEFMVKAESGEGTFYQCDKCSIGLTQDYVQDKHIDSSKPCSECKKGMLIKYTAIEWGHVFKQDHFYTQPHEGYFMDKDGKKKLMWMGAYGIGVERTMATIVETHHDEKGIVWPEEVAPFKCVLIGIKNYELRITNKTKQIYEQLTKAGVEVLWDDRDVSVGQKFADADLLGIPHRLVVSEKTGEKVEAKSRHVNKMELLSLQQLIKKFK
jgi:prolyl-tRNA synthetase